MTQKKLLFVTALSLLSCVRKPAQFATPAGHDRSIIFPVSIGRELIEIQARENTYDLDGEVMRALMIAAQDYIPPGIQNPPCWARYEALTYRFTRREDIIFVYIGENSAYCGSQLRPMHSGAKYAISKEGRILRRVIDGMDEDDHLWSLRTPDGGTVTVATESSDSPDLEELDRPDSGVLKIITEPVNMPGVMVIEPTPGFKPVEEGPGNTLGSSMFPFDPEGRWQWRAGKRVPVPQEPPPAPSPDLDGGTSDAGWDGGAPGDAGPGSLSAPPCPPDAGAAAPSPPNGR